mmetsp:Transcript_21636/g.35036  ORF Transcript_21636/g.35036 Transcript_21636/m.35036 type:complete len:228 (-) Transcript_21636:815-1498(-)
MLLGLVVPPIQLRIYLATHSRAHDRYLSACSDSSLAEAFASRKSSPTSSRSPIMISSRPLVLASTAAGVSSCTACRSDVLLPTSPRYDRLSSSTCSPSTVARTARIFTISSAVYGKVRMITRRSSRSTGTPWGAFISVPLIWQIPRLVAKMTMGARLDSNARFRYVKHSMSSMCTSSMNSTPGTSSATPVSMYRFTTLLISERSFSVISVFFDFIICPMTLMMSFPP